MQEKPHKILKVAVDTPLYQALDYRISGDLKVLPGCRVLVPFRNKEVVAVALDLIDVSQISNDKLKDVISVIDEEPLFSPELLQLCQWAAEYYHYPIGEVLAHALPALLRQGKPAELGKKRYWQAGQSLAPLVLNHAQQLAVNSILEKSKEFQVFLLNGITGSGKTEVYLHAITHFLQQGKQVLVLVPEIGLTPQTIERFRERFEVPVAGLHSGLTNKERLYAWLTAKSGEAKIIIGTRSAVFTPFKDLGCIIIDEEHDLSFKQQEGFRYHARDLAIMRAHFQKIPIVLGSATPSLEVLHKVNQGRYQQLLLSERAGAANLPNFQIVDVRNVYLEEGLSPTLLKIMKEHLERGEQVMLFLNRRGFAPVYMCHQCGWTAICKRCDARLTVHFSPERLHCHHCDSRYPLSPKCGDCKTNGVQVIGLGTERLEQSLQKHFPQSAIARIDRDNTQRKGEMQRLLDGIQNGDFQILIGTQMLAKGHHFPNVTLVAIVDTDAGFFSTDFRAIEKMGQLILQVSGRAGRADKPGTVIIQTHHPEHPLLLQLLREEYGQFAKTLLTEREQALLPPFAYMALFRAEAHQLAHATEFLAQIKSVSHTISQHLQILGPIPAPLARRSGRYRVQLLLQAKQRPHLQQHLSRLLPEVIKLPNKSKVRFSLDIDPLEMV